MYAWIWRHLPFGLPGKIGGSLVLFAAVAALLWYVVFPLVDPWVEEVLLPWDQSQVTGELTPGSDTVDPANEVVGPDGQVLDPHDIPYDTEE